MAEERKKIEKEREEKNKSLFEKIKGKRGEIKKMAEGQEKKEKKPQQKSPQNGKKKYILGGFVAGVVAGVAAQGGWKMFDDTFNNKIAIPKGPAEATLTNGGGSFTITPGEGKVIIYSENDVKGGKITGWYINPNYADGLAEEIIVSKDDFVVSSSIPNSALEKCPAIYQVNSEDGADMVIGEESDSMHLENGYYVLGSLEEKETTNGKQKREVLLLVGTGAVSGYIDSDKLERRDRMVIVKEGSVINTEGSFSVDNMKVEGLNGTKVTLDNEEVAFTPEIVIDSPKITVRLESNGLEGTTDKENIKEGGLDR